MYFSKNFMERFSWLEGKKIQTEGVSNTVKKGMQKACEN